jgi:hypothetical protein
VAVRSCLLACSLVLLLSLAGGAARGDSPPLNGFSIEKRVVEAATIREGGPERDRIRSVDAPQFVPPPEATWCPPPVPVIGMALNGEARAYPVHLMEYHQVVNDELGGEPVALTFDPLTAVPKGWRRTVDGKVLQFGVSGLLWEGQFLLYDRETESLWAQYEGRAVAGPLAGKRLEEIPVHQEPMGIWFQRHTDTLVLARPEKKRIDYRHSPYEVYWVSEKIPFEVKARDDRYHPKEVVLGVEVEGQRRAYLGSILTAEGGKIVDEIAGRKIRILYDSESGTFVWEAPEDVRVTDAYWFAWKAFHPDTGIWHDAKPAPDAGSD